MSDTPFPSATGNLAQGYAKVATASDRAKDNIGVTFPNLHRRIDPDLNFDPDELEITAYNLTTENGFRLTTEDGDYLICEAVSSTTGEISHAVLVAGVNSYRHTQREPSTEIMEDEEIP